PCLIRRPATTPLYTLSLHDALPISPGVAAGVAVELLVDAGAGGVDQVHDGDAEGVGPLLEVGDLLERPPAPRAGLHGEVEKITQDRKSTRLNSSHRTISYAVFCLKK